MIKILKVDKDTYITNRVIDNVSKTASNLGRAGSLDLFKLFGQTFSGSVPNVELSRLLLHFDLSSLQALSSSNKIDVANPSFFAKIKLYDVYGGQTTPENYDIVVNPLSASFIEGRGIDVALYSDLDSANFLSSSLNPWTAAGCAGSGSVTDTCDFFTSSNLNVTKHVVFDEDLEIDVTNILRSQLNGEIPDSGFRIALSQAHENDDQTYFVKRFASRQAYDKTKHPKLIVGFDDSVQDDTQRLSFEDTGVLFFYNKLNGSYANIVSSSVEITGSNSLLLKLETPISGGQAVYYFTGSQHAVGSVISTGIYSASILLHQTDAVIQQKLQQSGSVNFVPIWSSLDETVGFLTGSVITIYPNSATSALTQYRYTISVSNLKIQLKTSEQLHVRTNIFDAYSSRITAKKLPMVLPGIVLRDVHYAVRDKSTNEYIIDFDTTKNSTRLSSDINGMYFKLDASNLIPDRSYVIDILLTGEHDELYQDVSPVFHVHT